MPLRTMAASIASSRTAGCRHLGVQPMRRPRAAASSSVRSMTVGRCWRGMINVCPGIPPSDAGARIT